MTFLPLLIELQNLLYSNFAIDSKFMQQLTDHLLVCLDKLYLLDMFLCLRMRIFFFNKIEVMLLLSDSLLLLSRCATVLTRLCWKTP